MVRVPVGRLLLASGLSALVVSAWGGCSDDSGGLEMADCGNGDAQALVSAHWLPCDELGNPLAGDGFQFKSDCTYDQLTIDPVENEAPCHSMNSGGTYLVEEGTVTLTFRADDADPWEEAIYGWDGDVLRAPPGCEPGDPQAPCTERYCRLPTDGPLVECPDDLPD